MEPGSFSSSAEIASASVNNSALTANEENRHNLHENSWYNDNI